MKVAPAGESGSAELAAALRELLEHHQPHDIVVLSPFGTRSLVGRLLAAEHFTKEERWLRDRLRPVGDLGLVDASVGDAVVEMADATAGASALPLPAPAEPRVPSGRVRWGSIFKFKGLDAEAVILTDIGDNGLVFAQRAGLDWFDLLYVGLTRARYRCVVVPN